MRDAAHRERAVQSLAMMTDHDTLEDLNALAGTLDHLHMHTNRIAGRDLWHISAQMLFLDGSNQRYDGHDSALLLLQIANAQYNTVPLTRATGYFSQ